MNTDHDSAGAVPLDGNSAAGLLSEFFAFEPTVARVTCAGCGETSEIGAARVYGGTMGAILRCARCDTAVVRMVRTPAGCWLDMQGTRRLFVAMGEVS